MVSLSISTLSLALLAAAFAIDVKFDSTGSMVRRELAPTAENGKSEVRMSSAGELSLSKAEASLDFLRSQQPVHGQASCDYAFYDGVPGTNNCEGAGVLAGGTNVRLPSACKVAASLRGFHTTTTNFEIDSDSESDHPKGCFYQACSEDTTNGCYWYNGIENAPTGNLSGTPICERKKFENGTASAGAENTCPNGYRNMESSLGEDHDAGLCKKMAECLSYCKGGEIDDLPFLVHEDTQSQYHNFPIGCFIHATDGCVYFNKRETTLGLPSNPSGIPVCFLNSLGSSDTQHPMYSTAAPSSR